MRRRSCAERYLNVRPRGMGRHGTYMRVATRAREAGPPSDRGSTRAQVCAMASSEPNPPTEMTVRIRKMRACVSCVRVRVVRVAW